MDIHICQILGLFLRIGEYLFLLHVFFDISKTACAHTVSFFDGSVSHNLLVVLLVIEELAILLEQVIWVFNELVLGVVIHLFWFDIVVGLTKRLVVFFPGLHV